MSQSSANLQDNTVRTWKPFSKMLYSYVWRDSHFLGIIRQFCLDVKYSYQRTMYGYCDYDLFSIDYWFLDIMSRMLRQFKDTRHGSPVMTEYPDGARGSPEKEAELSEVWAKMWDETLDRMIFLFRESREETCGRENPYEQEHERVCQEFEEKYGLFGEKLLTEEEQTDKAGQWIHFPSELPEYEEIEKKYFDEVRKLEEDREEHKDEAFKLFSKWFYHLWD